MLQRLLVVLIFTVVTVGVSAQSGGKFYLSGGGGLSSYYGDLKDARSLTGDIQANHFSYGAYLGAGYHINNFLSAEFNFTYAQLKSDKTSFVYKVDGDSAEGVGFSSTIYEPTIRLNLDIMEMLNEGSPLAASVSAGGGYILSNPSVQSISLNTEFLGQDASSEKSNIPVVLFGGHLGYDLTSSFAIRAETFMRYALSDQIDGFEGDNGGNDWYNVSGLSLTYTFGNSNDVADEEAAPDPRRLFVGQYTYNNLPKSGVKLNLFDENDNLLSATETNTDGTFDFQGLKPGKEYTVKLADEDIELEKGTKIYVVNGAGSKVDMADRKGNNRYVYSHMSQDDVNEMSAIEVDDSDTKVEGVFTYKKLAKGGVKLNLYDNSGVKVGSTVTDISGKFKFQGLSPDENYLVKLNEDDKDLFSQGKLYLTNSEGQRVAASERPEFNEFKFTHLTTTQRDGLSVLEEVDSEAKMRGVFTYNDLPKAGVKMYIVDNEDNKIDSVVTGVDGSFQFSELAPNKSYMVKVADGMVDESKGIDIFFLNDEEEVVMRAGREKDEKFSFEAMDSEDIATLQVLHAEVAGEGKMLYRKESLEGEYIKGAEPDSNAMEGFELVGETPDSKDKPRDPNESLYNVSFEKETIFFDHNKYSISQNQSGSKGSVIAKKLKANPAMRIEVQGYASQPGTEAYNLLLSQRRADELKDLLVEKYGIDPGRIVPVGKGEDPSVSATEARRARIIILE